MYYRARPPKLVLEGSESGIGLCPFPLRKMTGREQTGGEQRGGGTYHKWGGSKTVFGEGFLWYVPPTPEFSTPLCFSLDKARRPAKFWNGTNIGQNLSRLSFPATGTLDPGTDVLSPGKPNASSTSTPSWKAECTKIAHRRSLAIFAADSGIAGNSAVGIKFVPFNRREIAVR